MKISTVQEKFNQAPEKIQDIIMSVDTSEALSEIEKKYEVYKEENGLRILPKETADVLIGITHPKDFVPALVEKLDVSKEKAQEIAKEVNQKIFSQVKDLLIEIHGLNPTPQKGTGFTKEEKTLPQSSNTPPKPKAAASDIGSSDVAKPTVATNLPAERKGFGEVKPKKTGVPIPQKPPQNHSFPSGQAPKNHFVHLGQAVPQKNVVPETTPIPAVPTPPQNLHRLADHAGQAPQKIPTPAPQNLSAERKDSGVVIPKNPFEEKLRQTFTIPPKDSSSHSGSVPKKPESENTPPTLSSSETKPAFATPEPLAKAGVAESSGAVKPSSVGNFGAARKKEEIKNNPYLETIE